MTQPPDPDLPKHDQLADDDDELGWDREQHGKMADFAVPPGGEIQTEPYDPDADPFLHGEG